MICHSCSEYLNNAVLIRYRCIDLQQLRFGLRTGYDQCFCGEDRIPTDIGAEIQNCVARFAQAGEYSCLKRFPDAVTFDIAGNKAIRVGMNCELERWNVKSVRSYKPILFTVDVVHMLL